MKIKLFFLILFVSINASSQLLGLHKFKINKSDERIFKISGIEYKTDFKTFFSSDTQTIYENNTNEILYFMIYDKKYLFVGYYPNTVQDQMSSIGYEIRSLNKMDVIDLKNPSKKWTYQFNKRIAMGLIKSFNPKDGDIIFCSHIKPVKKE